MTQEEEDWFDEMCKKHGAKNLWKKPSKKKESKPIKAKAKTKSKKTK